MKDVGTTSNLKSDIKLAIKKYNLGLVRSAVWLTVCTMLSAGLSACDFSALIIFLFAHDEPFGIHHEWGWVLSAWKKKKTYSDRPLILRLSSNVRWWSASRSGWGMLSRTALEDFTSWSSRSQRFSDVLGKITSTSNLPSLRPGNYAAVTSNQLNLPFFICVIKVISAWNNHIKRAPCRRAKFNLWLLSDNFLMKAISLIFLHLRAPAERQETGEEVGLRGMPTKGGQH